MAASVRGGLQIRAIISALTLLVLITGLGLFATRTSMATKDLLALMLCLCAFLMLYGLIWAQQAIARLKRHQGVNDCSILAHSLQAHLGWMSFLRLSFFILWQILVWEFARFFLIVMGTLGSLLVIESRWVKRTQDRYYPLLSKTLLSWEVLQRWRDLRLRIILNLCLGIALLINHVLLFHEPLGLWGWLQDYLRFSFCIVCIGIAVDVKRLQPWSKRAKALH